MISKNIVSEVLGKRVFSVKEINNKIEIYYNENGSNYILINIYELAHLCKEYIRAKNLSIFSGYATDNKQAECLLLENYATDKYRFIADAEPEAIFKAVEYLIEQDTQMMGR